MAFKVMSYFKDWTAPAFVSAVGLDSTVEIWVFDRPVCGGSDR